MILRILPGSTARQRITRDPHNHRTGPVRTQPRPKHGMHADNQCASRVDRIGKAATVTDPSGPATRRHHAHGEVPHPANHPVGGNSCAVYGMSAEWASLPLCLIFGKVTGPSG